MVKRLAPQLDIILAEARLIKLDFVRQHWQYLSSVIVRCYCLCTYISGYLERCIVGSISFYISLILLML